MLYQLQGQIVGMLDDLDERAEKFIASFDGDILAAQDALLDYQKRYERTVARDGRAGKITFVADPIISVQNVTKQYKLGKQTVVALNDISLTIGKGEFVAITGASGSGKSTLLQLIGGLDQPTSGVITVDDRRLDSFSDRRLSKFRNKTIGFVFQFFYLQPFLTLQQNIEVATMPNRMKKRIRNERIQQLAMRVGLSDRLKHLPQRVIWWTDSACRYYARSFERTSYYYCRLTNW